MPVILAFTMDQVSELTGLTPRQLRYWSDTGFFSPTFSGKKRSPYRRIFSFRDVVALRTLAMLRIEHEIPLQELRRVAQWFNENVKDPWATQKFYVLGKRVLFHDPELDLIRVGSNPVQSVIPIVIHEVAASTACDADRLKDRTSEEIGRIVRHRYTSHNAHVLAGTRIRTEAVWNFHQEGYSTDDIIRQYPRLTPEDVSAAIEFEQMRQRAAS